MTTINLPDLPAGKEFEELVAAYFQCAGRYVERNIVDRQEEDVLELDIIVTSYESGVPPANSLVEVKGGKWGFTDIFKIRGWLDYIGMSDGALVVQEPRRGMDSFQRIGDRLQVRVIAIPERSTAAQALELLPGAAQVQEIDLDGWRFSYWTERQTLRRIIANKKSMTGKKCYAALDRYFSLIANRTFFTENIIERAEKLYETFQEFPNVSAKLAHELQGDDFDSEYDSVPRPVFSRAYYEGKLNGLELSTYVEHRSRLAVMKAAIDYQLFKVAGRDQNLTHTFKLGDVSYEYTRLDTMPLSFQAGIKTISTHPYFHRYPVFWQWFLWFFGGFILNDYQAHEYAFLADRTGIPVKHIPEALEAYNILFPLETGWFMEHPSNNVKIMKLFPITFMGVGANIRRWLYSQEKEWKGLRTTGENTLRDLIKWNNAAVELLSWKG
ncbi:MAG: hypothetical protein U0822_15485 [Anaerolineae bacterium]